MIITMKWDIVFSDRSLYKTDIWIYTPLDLHESYACLWKDTCEILYNCDKSSVIRKIEAKVLKKRATVRERKERNNTKIAYVRCNSLRIPDDYSIYWSISSIFASYKRNSHYYLVFLSLAAATQTSSNVETNEIHMIQRTNKWTKRII